MAMKLIPPSWALLGILLQACAAAPGGAPPLFTAANRADNRIDESMAKRAVRYRFVDISPQFIDGSAVPANLVLNLFDDVTVTAIRERWEQRPGNNFSWLGKVDGVVESQVTLVVENGFMAGTIRLRDAFYSVRSTSSGSHVIYEIDPLAFPREASPVLPKR